MVEAAQWAAIVANAKIGTFTIPIPPLTPNGAPGWIKFINGIMADSLAPT